MPLHLYLSPHLDDAVLSCGGLIHRQVQAGDDVLVLTIFAGDPPQGVRSAFAQELAHTWQSPDNPVVTRRAEDRAALASLGAHWLHWEFADCIFRHDPHSGAAYYPSRDAIFAEVHPAERTALLSALAARLEAFCAERRPDTIYSLLTAGHHVDHQIVQSASRQLRAAGWVVRYYEDYPYVEQPGCLDAALAAAGGAWQSRIEPLAPADLTAKIEAIARYPSQLPGLFGSGEAMPERVRAYTHSVTGAGPAERYWRPAEACG